MLYSQMFLLQALQRLASAARRHRSQQDLDQQLAAVTVTALPSTSGHTEIHSPSELVTASLPSNGKAACLRGRVCGRVYTKMALVLILTYLEDCPQAKSIALAEGEANLERRLAAVTHREARAAQAMQETSLICHQAKEELEGALQHVNQIGAELQATKRHHAKACPLTLRCCQSLTSLVLQLFPPQHLRCLSVLSTP